MAAVTLSEPSSPVRLGTPPPTTLSRHQHGTATPPARPIPTDFKSSLAAWWSSNGYRDARMAEERLLRRMAYFQPTPPAPSKSWLPWASVPELEPEVAVVPTITSASGLVASVRNVFIPTPDPNDAPSLVDKDTQSASNSVSSGDKKHHHNHHNHNHHHRVHHHKDDGKLVDYINTLEISRPDLKDSKEAVVVLHGYAAALGFFFRNWDSVATSAAMTGRRAFFLDWLGMGLSSRPNPSLLASPGSAPVEARVSRAEHFFLASLESWRIAAGVERMVLVGHSLGGYLASAYALRYPDRVSSLILVSPAGIPHGPDDLQAGARQNPTGTRGPTGPGGKPIGSTPTPTTTASAADSRTSLDEATDAAETELHAGPKGEAKQWQRDQSAMRRGMAKMFVWGWEKGLSPFSILRGIGPWGPMLVGKYSSRRFAAQSSDDVRDLHSYIYGTTVLKGSGEFCISHILAPGAYARMPIVDRIDKLKVPVTFLYGDNDWMDVEGGYASQKVLAKAGNRNVGVHVIPGAGHHLYLDNPTVTNRILDEAIFAAPKLD